MRKMVYRPSFFFYQNVRWIYRSKERNKAEEPASKHEKIHRKKETIWNM